MKITVRLFATLRENRGKVIEMETEKGVNGYDIIRELKIDSKDVAIFLINGIDGKLDTALKNEDVLSIFPPVGGG